MQKLEVIEAACAQIHNDWFRLILTAEFIDTQKCLEDAFGAPAVAVIYEAVRNPRPMSERPQRATTLLESQVLFFYATQRDTHAEC